MEILLALIFGAAVGAAAHAALPHRETRGVALGPVLGALIAGATWMAMTWAGFALDNPWVWVTSIAAPAVVTFPVIALVTRARIAHDSRDRARLKIV